MADAKQLAERLRKLAAGTVEWRVADPQTGSYCIAFEREHEADRWLADHKAKFPNSMHADKVVARVHWFGQLEQAAREAADLLDPAALRVGVPHPDEFDIDDYAAGVPGTDKPVTDNAEKDAQS